MLSKAVDIEGHELRFAALSPRTRRRLARCGFKTLEDVATRSRGELNEVYKLSREALNEIEVPLRAAGMNYREER